MIVQMLFLVYFFIGLSISHPSSTERSVDSYSDDSYQEIFPIPLLDYLKEYNFPTSTDPPINLSTNFINESKHLDNPPYNPIDQLNKQSANKVLNDEVNLHALPRSIELNEQSFIVVHRPDQNQYLDMGRVNGENVEKKFILTELRPFSSFSKLTDESFSNQPNLYSESTNRPKDQTSISIQSNSFNLNLSLSISQSTAVPSNLNATGSNLTSLNVVLSDGRNESVSLNLVSNPTVQPVTANTITIQSNATTVANSTGKLSGLATSELVSTNIEQPKELAKNVAKKNDPTRSMTSDEIDINRTLTSVDEIDNSTSLNNATYSSLGEDNLNVNDMSFNKINSSSLDLILELNDTIADEINLNSNNQNRTG